MKAELIIANPDFGEIKYRRMVIDAAMFFSKYTNSSKVSIDSTKEGHDITINGIEVGSYGGRQFNGFTWIYGTGCAEPRLSEALKNE